MKINGHILHKMLVSAANALDNKQIEINNMNVFPVPDGDTGVNMTLTISPVRDMKDSDAVSDLAKQAASLILRAARGNSGAILSLFFRGMSKVFCDLQTIDSPDLARAFRRGTDEAYKAVMNPTEGTILTVMRCSTEAAEKAVAEGKFKGDVKGFFKYVLAAAEEALAETPELLPILKEVHVVDAGGFGFVTVLKGMLAALNKKPVVRIAKQETAEEATFSDFNTESITFGYCTECIVEKTVDFAGEGHADDLKAFISGIGDSVVFVEDEAIIKLHVHTDHPGEVIEHAMGYGALLTVKIENMRKQQSALIEKENAEKEKEEPKKPYGFVTVCNGEGIKATFVDLGVDRIIYGGQTMNPSTQDILDGIEGTPAETVYVLPNNKNIYMVAEQAACLVKEKNVIVLPTRSVPQGISALLAFDEGRTPEENTETMKEAFQNVVTMSVTHAVRDTTIDGEAIKDGQMLGLIDGEIGCVADSPVDCVKALAEKMGDAAFVTVFYGADTSDAEAEEVEKYLLEKLPNAEQISVISGGQIIYNYVISVE